MKRKLTTDFIEKTQNSISIFYNEFLKLIREEIKEKQTLIVPDDIEEHNIFCNIAYNGGNHPEYASDCFARYEQLTWDNRANDVLIHFSEFGAQYLDECNLDGLMNIAEFIIFMNDPKNMK